MKLNCKVCKQPILTSNVNFSQGIARCESCNEYFNIAGQLLSGNQEAEKPYTKVVIEPSFDHHLVTVPAPGWTSSTIIILAFAVIWNLMAWGGLSRRPNLFLLIFVAVGIYLIGYLFFLVMGKIVLRFDRQNVSATWQVGRFKYTKVRNTAGFQNVDEYVTYGKHRKPYFKVGLYFSNENNITFGSNMLEPHERQWLVRELNEIRKKYRK